MVSRPGLRHTHPEEGTIFRQLIDHRGFIKSAAIDPDIGPAQIVDQEKNDIGF